MDPFKIKVKDEQNFKEVVSLINTFGYGINFSYSNASGEVVKGLFLKSYGLVEWTHRDTYFDLNDSKELTLPQLRDLVVLKRNDVKDATHRDKRDESIYLTSDKVIYYWQGEWCKSAINKSNDYENYIANSLTPITQPQDPALISGADVPALIKKGESVQFRSVFNVQGGGEWKDLDLERDEEEFSLGDLINTRFEWRLKPQTIKLNFEIPAPYKAKIGGRDDASFVLNVGRHQYCYKTEEDYLKARDSLETVFDAALRGTNS